MTDPLTEVAALLKPRAKYAKIATGAGEWSVRREESGRPFYCAVMLGEALLQADGKAPLPLQAGDFVIIPAAQGFTMSSRVPPNGDGDDPDLITQLEGETRHGRADGPADVRLMIGYCDFRMDAVQMLASLLPSMIHVRGEPRLTTLVEWLHDESVADRPGKQEVSTKLLELLLVEALRSTSSTAPSPGLVRALQDARLAKAIRKMHRDPARRWSVPALAGEAAMSRTTFFEKFNRAVGMAPMEYLFNWRMALAKRLLRDGAASVAVVAEQIGYGSTTAFNTAFSKHAGVSPGRYARTRSHQDAFSEAFHEAPPRL